VYAVECGRSALEIAGHAELILQVVDDPPYSKKVFPIPYSIQDRNWLPGHFAEYVYLQIQDMLRDRGHEYCVYGHCTSEQAVVDMSKKGMSPFASMTNRMSCGHAMYFFRMEESKIPFNDLSNGAGEEKSDGEQFRTFVYALSIPFVKGDCHPLSPAVLLFLIRKDEVEVFDAVTEKLPIVTTDLSSSYSLTSASTSPSSALGSVIAAERWTCRCKRQIQGSINLTMDHLTFSESNFRAADIANAVATVDDAEKFNCIALLSGVVDFNVIGRDAIVTRVSNLSLLIA
jgi:hypothetical protein